MKEDFFIRPNKISFSWNNRRRREDCRDRGRKIFFSATREERGRCGRGDKFVENINEPESFNWDLWLCCSPPLPPLFAGYLGRPLPLPSVATYSSTLAACMICTTFRTERMRGRNFCRVFIRRVCSIFPVCQFSHSILSLSFLPLSGKRPPCSHHEGEEKETRTYSADLLCAIGSFFSPFPPLSTSISIRFGLAVNIEGGGRQTNKGTLPRAHTQKGEKSPPSAHSRALFALTEWRPRLA